MPQTVQVGGDTLQFPDEMSDADISAAIHKEYGAKSAAAPAAPAPEGAIAPTAPLKPDNLLGLQWGIKRPIDNAAIWAEHGVNALTGGHSHGAEDVYARDQARIAAAAAEGRRPGMAGDIAGSVISGAPIALALKNPLLVGAAQGALNTSKPNDSGAVAVDTGMGAGLGKLGQMASNAVGGVIAPKINPLVRSLLNKKVELTPGQIMGGAAHRLEDASKTIFGLGDMVIGSQANAQRSFARGAVQDTLDPIGEKLPKNLMDGHAQVAYAGNKLSDAYKAITADIDAVAPGKQTGVHMDPTFTSNMVNLRTLAAGLGKDQRDTFDHIVKQQIQPAFNPRTGVASGATLKTLDEYLGKQMRDFASSQNPYDRQLSSALQEAQAQVRDLIGRQFPAHATALGHLNDGWAKLVRVEQAAKGARGGNFTPEQLRQAVVNQATGVRGRSAARGEALLQDYADTGSRVMSNTVNDSGTGTRALATGLAGYALLGKNPMALHINPMAAGALGAMSLPYVNRTTSAVARGLIAGAPKTRGAIRKAVQSVTDPLAPLVAPRFGKGIESEFE